jgi:guanylate kinase
MSKLIMIVGLPCSGKTTYINKYFVDKNYIIFDDMIKEKGNTKEAVIEALNKNNNVVVADPYLVMQDIRTAAKHSIQSKVKDVKIFWIYFENNLTKCLKNLERRIKKGDNRKVKEFIKSLSKEYTIPSKVKIITIND